MSDDTDDGFRRQIDARIGRTLCNKYTLEKVLGIGGMATVYRGSHRNGNRVAVKVLHTELSVSKDIKDRFLREGYVANKVDHDGAVRVLDDDTAEDGSVFLVMELLEGETLEDCILRQGGTLSLRELVPYACELLDVLTSAHDKGIVHRDIKPENVFIERRDRAVKVLDFGIARLNDSARQATRTGRVMGTPVYMAPEQARGETKLIDGQTDLWAVGAILFRALTGRYVHDAETPEMVLITSATQPAPRIQQLVPSLHPSVAEIIDRALVTKKDERWRTAQAMSTALRSIALDALGDGKETPAAGAGFGPTLLDSSASASGTGPSAQNATAQMPGVTPVSNADANSAYAGTTGGLAHTAQNSTDFAPEIPTSSRAMVLGIAATLLVVGGIGATYALTRASQATTPASLVQSAASATAPASASASSTATPPSAIAPAGAASPSASNAVAAADPKATASADAGSTAVANVGAAGARTPTTSTGVRSPTTRPAVSIEPAKPTPAAASPAPATSTCVSKKILNAEGNWQWIKECTK